MRSAARFLRTSSYDEFRKSDLYNIAVRPAGGFYGIVAPLLRGPDHRILLAIARNLGSADFTAEDVRATNLIGSHLVTALKVWQRIADSEGRASAAFEAIERLSIGAVFLDEKMRPVLANPCAETLARSRDGLLLEAHRLSAIRPDDAKNLADAIASATRFGGARHDAPESATLASPAWKCLIHRDPPRSPLIARVIPVGPPYRSSMDVASARTIVFIMEPDRPPAIDASSLSSTFGFTHREAALAAGLVQGADLRQAARQMNIGIGTARSYLKRVLSKTDTHRQAELVSFLLRSSLETLGDRPAERQNGVYDRNV